MTAVALWPSTSVTVYGTSWSFGARATRTLPPPARAFGLPSGRLILRSAATPSGSESFFRTGTSTADLPRVSAGVTTSSLARGSFNAASGLIRTRITALPWAFLSSWIL